MTDTFDWAGLWQGAEAAKHDCMFCDCDAPNEAAAAYLRERIEAAFVPRVKYDHPTFVHRVDRARYHLALCSADRIGAMISFSDEENANLTARAEAAEAENARLRAFAEHYARQPCSCGVMQGAVTCGPCNARQALGAEHGK